MKGHTFHYCHFGVGRRAIALAKKSRLKRSAHVLSTFHLHPSLPDDMVTRSKMSFRFLDLPPEPRNAIYVLLVERDEPIVVTQNRQLSWHKLYRQGDDKISPMAPWVRECHETDSYRDRY